MIYKTAAMAFIFLLFPPSVLRADPVRTVEGGAIRQACAPLDGAAFDIVLDSLVKATVYASLDAVEKSGAAALFQAKGEAAKEGDAVISKCDETGKTCQDKKGDIAITTIIGDTVTGVIRLPVINWGRGAGAMEMHMFRVRYDRSAALCG